MPIISGETCRKKCRMFVSVEKHDDRHAHIQTHPFSTVEYDIYVSRRVDVSVRSMLPSFSLQHLTFRKVKCCCWCCCGLKHFLRTYARTHSHTSIDKTYTQTHTRIPFMWTIFRCCFELAFREKLQNKNIRKETQQQKHSSSENFFTMNAMKSD